MPHSALTALSPLDGRYAAKVEALRPIFSEYGLMKRRVLVEVHWLMALADAAGHRGSRAVFRSGASRASRHRRQFSVDDAARIKDIERTTNHDVKAVEYFLKERIAGNAELAKAAEFVHFACTSEDINNLAYALMLRDARADVLLPTLDAVDRKTARIAHALAAQPMLSRTHGQTASPTTLGKEIANVVARLRSPAQADCRGRARRARSTARSATTTRTSVAYPEVDWPAFSRALRRKRSAWNAIRTRRRSSRTTASPSSAMRSAARTRS